MADIIITVKYAGREATNGGRWSRAVIIIGIHYLKNRNKAVLQHPHPIS